MPFFGSDWRAPGDKWIRTDVGWKRLSDIHITFQRQLGKVAASVFAPASAVVKRNGARMRSHSGSPRSNSSRANSRASSPIREKTEKNAFSEQRLQVINFSLTQRCISARKSSRESNHYATMSDAINKLNFNQALYDSNCYPFICQVVEIIFEDRYWTLSGSMQTTLLRLTDTAKDIAIESRHHTRSILRLLRKQITTLEKGRSKMMTGYSVTRLDSKIKTLLSYRAQLIGELQRTSQYKDGGSYGGHYNGVNSPCLPDDCWRHIISFLADPRDVLNLGSVNSILYIVTCENRIWDSLLDYHYGRGYPVDELTQPTIAMDTFRHIYMMSGKKLKVMDYNAVVLCRVCDCVYWRDYGHPCTVLLSSHSTISTCSVAGTTKVVEDCKKQLHDVSSSTGLTAHQFVQLYQC